MLKSRLIQVLRTFSKKEFRELNKWVNSPFHNQREDVIALYDYLVTTNHLFNDNLLNKPLVFSKIYPNESFDDSKMRQVMHFFFKTIEEFLFFQKESGEEIKKKLSLLKIYKERKLDKSFYKTQKDIENFFKRKIEPKEDDLFTSYQIKKEIVEFNSKIKRSQELNLQELSDTYDEAFIVEKLKHACLALAHKRVFNIDYEIGLLGEVLEFTEEKNLLGNSRIGIHFYLYKILNENKVEDFYILKNYLKNVEHFPQVEIKEAYGNAINFCASQINSGNKDFIKEAFYLYKNGIEKGIFIENNLISRWAFKNAIVVGLKLKEFEWVENFIENYNQYLEEKHRESFLYFNYAMLHYEKGNYNKVLEVIQKYEFTDILVNLNAKIILVKVYYELEEIKVLESFLESMRAYIQRKKVIGYQKIVYKNMLKYTKKLLKVNPYSKTQKEKLKAEIEAAKPLTEKTWLLKQLAEL